MIPASPAERTITIIELARHGRFDDIRDLFLEQLRPMVSADVLRARLGHRDKPAGAAPFGRGRGGRSGAAAHRSGQGPRHLRTRSNDGRRVAELDWPPDGDPAGAPKRSRADRELGPPDYAAPEQFEEQEVSAGPGPQVVLDMAEWVNTGQLSP